MNPPKSDDPEELEAMIRIAMSEHAGIRPRGFDTRRARQVIHEFIDELLDDYGTEQFRPHAS